MNNLLVGPALDRGLGVGDGFCSGRLGLARQVSDEGDKIRVAFLPGGCFVTEFHELGLADRQGRLGQLGPVWFAAVSHLLRELGDLCVVDFRHEQARGVEELVVLLLLVGGEKCFHCCCCFTWYVVVFQVWSKKNKRKACFRHFTVYYVRGFGRGESGLLGMNTGFGFSSFATLLVSGDGALERGRLGGLGSLLGLRGMLSLVFWWCSGGFPVASIFGFRFGFPCFGSGSVAVSSLSTCCRVAAADFPKGGKIS